MMTTSCLVHNSVSCASPLRHVRFVSFYPLSLVMAIIAIGVGVGVGLLCPTLLLPSSRMSSFCCFLATSLSSAEESMEEGEWCSLCSQNGGVAGRCGVAMFSLLSALLRLLPSACVPRLFFSLAATGACFTGRGRLSGSWLGSGSVVLVLPGFVSNQILS